MPLSTASPRQRPECCSTCQHGTSLGPPAHGGEGTLPELRAYVLARVILRPQDDPDVILRALDWVAVQWRHDGLDEAAHGAGARFRCVEYGQVFSEVMRSLGLVARSISVKSPDIAYGGLGRSHVAAEAWSNSLRQWVFIDPQFGVYATHQGRLLDLQGRRN